jgi:hypothetical protein
MPKVILTEAEHLQLIETRQDLEDLKVQIVASIKAGLGQPSLEGVVDEQLSQIATLLDNFSP